jgi:hypothetical protein
MHILGASPGTETLPSELVCKIRSLGESVMPLSLLEINSNQNHVYSNENHLTQPKIAL